MRRPVACILMVLVAAVAVVGCAAREEPAQEVAPQPRSDKSMPIATQTPVVVVVTATAEEAEDGEEPTAEEQEPTGEVDEGAETPEESTEAPTEQATEPPTIVSFTADRTNIVEGDSVKFTWEAKGGSEASISWYNQQALPMQVSDLDPDGGTRSIKPTGPEMRLTVRNEFGQAEETIQLTIACAHEWAPALGDNHPERCPGPLAAGAAAQQQFEKGFMIWFGPSGKIFVFYKTGYAGSGPRYHVYDDTFREGEPESDPGITPPAGLLQPIRGFGKVWRNNPEVRDGLGWATGSEKPFSSWVQGYTGTGMHASFTLIEEFNGTIYHLEAMGSTWKVY
jgi:hypothetical protein